MSPKTRYSEYDRLAWFYNRYWGGPFSRLVLAIVDKLLVSHLPAQGRILDLCCGTGQLARGLVDRGFQVTGVDGSEEMLRYARENAPAAELILVDARSFELPPIFHAAVSVFDSLNHVMSLEDLTTVFRNVHAALIEGGRFLFDLNMEAGYRVRWRDHFAIVENDHVCVVRGRFDSERKLGRNDITMFRLEGNDWRRSDLTLWQKCYSESEVRSALVEAGFRAVSAYDAERDLGMVGGRGRSFFLASKSQ
jgi:SAM-dependent methyltransferase